MGIFSRGSDHTHKGRVEPGWSRSRITAEDRAIRLEGSRCGGISTFLPILESGKPVQSDTETNTPATRVSCCSSGGTRNRCRDCAAHQQHPRCSSTVLQGQPRPAQGLPTDAASPLNADAVQSTITSPEPVETTRYHAAPSRRTKRRLLSGRGPTMAAEFSREQSSRQVRIVEQSGPAPGEQSPWNSPGRPARRADSVTRKSVAQSRTSSAPSGTETRPG